VNGFVDRITRTAVRNGLRKGLLAGDGKWLALGAVAWLVRFLAKKQEPETVVEQLKVGESLVVTNLGPAPKRRERRRRQRQERVLGPSGEPS
jgi:hypothetical protein